MNTQDHLFILWTNADPITSEKMVLMYGLNSKLKSWWKEVTIIVWGAPAKLLAEDIRIQQKIKEAISIGVKVSACKACTDQLGVTEKLESLGVETMYWGQPLTDLLQSDAKLITI